MESKEVGEAIPKKLYVIKRNGTREPVHFDAITERLIHLIEMEPKLNSDRVDPVAIAQKVVEGVYPGIRTSELDYLASETAAYMSTIHPDYAALAARICVSDLQKQTSDSVVEIAEKCYHYVNPKTGQPSPLYSKETYETIVKHANVLQRTVCYARDYQFDYFGFKTLERSYLVRLNGVIVERPQHMYLRAAVGIHGDDIDGIVRTYDALSKGLFTHATPTLFNAGTSFPQMSSCFLIAMQDDSIDGIYDTLKKCAVISKYSGGIGLSVHNIRAKDSYIRGTGGTSNGLVPMLRVFNDTARYVDQCFPPTTVVKTKNGPVPIGSIKTGDEVLTHMGRFQPVTRVLTYSKKQEELIHVSVGSETICSTLYHPYLVARNDQDFQQEEIRFRVERGIVGLEWIEAQDIREGDYLVVPSEGVEGGITTYDYLRVVNLSRKKEESCELFDLEVDRDHSYVTAVGAVHNGGGKRKGAFAVYLEPWHADIFGFLDLKKNTGKEEYRARDLFYGLWIPDLFMRRVHDNESWSLFCPNEAPGLCDAWGKQFDDLYTRYEGIPGLARQTIRARDLWFAILESQIETGTPYMLYKDAVNAKSNQQNLGTIRSSNLCTEIVEYTSPSEVAVCLTGETRILTKDGWVEIAQCDGKMIWVPFRSDNDITFAPRWKKARLLRQGMKKVYKIVSSNTTIRCTHDHLFLSVSHYDGKMYLAWKRAYQLLPGVMLYGLDEEDASASSLSHDNLSMPIVESIEEEDEREVYDLFVPEGHHFVANGIVSHNCNLASIALPKFVIDKKFDHGALLEITKHAIKNLDLVIDRNYYPLEEAKVSNLKHRPTGLGVQGLADVFIMMRYPFDSPDARELNRDIFETIYFGALTASMELAAERGHYSTYNGSPVHRGMLQFDMWGVKPSDRWDWEDLREKIRQHGIRNSLLIAPMPTASTAQILGNNECVEPFTSNIYVRRVRAGEFVMVNRYLVRDLVSLGMWNLEMKNRIVECGGSIQDIAEIPKELRDIYKTVWEISMKTVIDMAADRGAFIDQSQSLNCFIAKPDMQKLTSMHFYAWKKGLKTGMYYLRTRPAADAIKFTVEQKSTPSPAKKESTKDGPTCSKEEGCDACGS